MVKQLSHLHIEAGPAGWAKVFWRRESGPDNIAFVRFRPPRTKRERWTISALQASKDSKPSPFLTSELLDDIPRHRIELALSAMNALQEDLLRDLDVAVPNDLDDAFRGYYREASRWKLERPPRGEMDDDFYRRVALTYRRALASGLPPLKTMADDSGIPQGTIARWVAAARDKGHLPKTSAGKVSA